MTKKIQKTTEQTAASLRADVARGLHIIEAWNGSFHVLEITGLENEPIKLWPGPFCLKRAAELLLEDMTEPYADGEIGTAVCPTGQHRPANIVERYEHEGEFVELMEKHGGVNDPRGLAKAILEKQPWRTHHQSAWNDRRCTA